MSEQLEILKLKEKLENANIPFEYNDDLFNGYKSPSYQIVILTRHNERLCDAVYHFGSYGHEQGLIEIMGALTYEEYENDSVLGYLTADEVFERFKYCYEHNTTVFKRKD